jgi:hypothetical protein
MLEQQDRTVKVEKTARVLPAWMAALKGTASKDKSACPFFSHFKREVVSGVDRTLSLEDDVESAAPKNSKPRKAISKPKVPGVSDSEDDVGVSPKKVSTREGERSVWNFLFVSPAFFGPFLTCSRRYDDVNGSIHKYMFKKPLRTSSCFTTDLRFGFEDSACGNFKPQLQGAVNVLLITISRSKNA